METTRQLDRPAIFVGYRDHMKKPSVFPGLPPGAPDGAFPLSKEELNDLHMLDTEQKLLKSESDKLKLRQDNLFLRIQIRTGKKMEGWGLDPVRGLCLPPNSRLVRDAQASTQEPPKTKT
jgi:hypothetical protein